MSVKTILKEYIMLLFIMLFSACLLIFLTTEKGGMHIDEYWTYKLANHENEKVRPEFGVKLNPTEVFDDYFYPKSFSIHDVWMNQRDDVHPPLFYLVFHIFSLLTRKFFSLKMGVLLNILFHMCSIGLIYQITKMLFGSKYISLLGAGMYAFMPIILGNVLFIRMYTMLSAEVLLLTLLFISGYDGRKISGIAFYVALSVLAVVGVLTHYYFLVYLFWCCVVWGFRLILSRKWKELATFLTAMVLAAVSCVAIFPYMLNHIFAGYRGIQSFDALLHSSFIDNLKVYLANINHVCGGFLVAVLFIVAYLFMIKTDYGKRMFCKRKVGCWSIILFPCLLYFFTICKISPMQEGRYISPIYGICIILLMGLFVTMAKYLCHDKISVILVICFISILLNGAWQSYDWPELHKEQVDAVKIAKEYGDTNECIYVFNAIWEEVYPNYQELAQYQNVTFIPINNIELLNQSQYKEYSSVVVYFNYVIGEDRIEEILNEIIMNNPSLTEYKKLYEYYYGWAYYLM